MTIQQLQWQQVQPDLTYIQDISDKGAVPNYDALALQPRIRSALAMLCPQTRKPYHPRFMVVKAHESQLLFSLLHQGVKRILPDNKTGYAYHFNENKITLTSAQSSRDNFAAVDNCMYATWFDMELLFGCVRQPKEGLIKLEPGLVHECNGGVLILSLRSLLSQPDLWARLQHMVEKKEYQWFSSDDASPLPFTIPSMPLDLRVILVGDRLSLAELQETDPELYNNAIYTEFENDLLLSSQDDLMQWADYVKFIGYNQQLPTVEQSAFIELVKEGVKVTEDQAHLPLSPDWVASQLTHGALSTNDVIDDKALKTAIEQKNWQENYLVERFREGIFTNQISINTRDEIVGQINGLSVVEYPGYPNAIGEPTRLSCVVHFGDGELIDIERKNELAGNLHSKGMMIMQAFISSEFAIHHQLPFSASLVFEQSYSEVDGDSASLAGLCALMSALSGQPIDQQLAVTGSVDQFGHVQAIGGINEKIAGFFAVCQHQGLTGKQGVVIPKANQRNLCLSDEITSAIAEGTFFIWTIENISDAIELLTKMPYKDENRLSLYQLIQTRIQIAMHYEKRPRRWIGRWFK